MYLCNKKALTYKNIQNNVHVRLMPAVQLHTQYTYIISSSSGNVNLFFLTAPTPHLSSVTAYIFLKIFNSLILSNFPLKSCRFSTVPDLKLY